MGPGYASTGTNPEFSAECPFPLVLVFPSSFLFCKCSAHSVLAVLHSQFLHPISRFSSFRKTDLSLGFIHFCSCSFAVLYDSTHFFLLSVFTAGLSAVLVFSADLHIPVQRLPFRFGCAFLLGLADICLLGFSDQRPPGSSPAQLRALPDRYFCCSSRLIYLG